VEQAQKEYRKAAEDDALAGLLVLFGSTPRIIHHFQVRDGRARGYDDKNELVSDVPIQEPTQVRPFHDQQRNIYRFNIL
jgi:nitrate reductase beta subunit